MQRARYEADPLYWHGGMKARWAVSMLDTIADLHSRLADVRLPFLVLHGDEDKLCLLSGSQNMYDQAVTDDKTLKVHACGC